MNPMLHVCIFLNGAPEMIVDGTLANVNLQLHDQPNRTWREIDFTIDTVVDAPPLQTLPRPDGLPADRA